MWGLYDGMKSWQTLAQAAAVALALGLAVLPRPRGIPALAAACAAVLIALQLGLEYWFYLYIVWFFPLVMVALLAAPDRRSPLTPTPTCSIDAYRADGWAPGSRAAGAAGRGIRTCSIESARNGFEQRITTPFSHGSSSEV